MIHYLKHDYITHKEFNDFQKKVQQEIADKTLLKCVIICIYKDKSQEIQQQSWGLNVSSPSEINLICQALKDDILDSYFDSLSLKNNKENENEH